MRTIGDPAIRFREDPIRILRAIKFCARLDLGIDPELYDAMIDQRQTVSRAPRRRAPSRRSCGSCAAGRRTVRSICCGIPACSRVMIPELAAYLDDAGDEADVIGAGCWRSID